MRAPSAWACAARRACMAKTSRCCTTCCAGRSPPCANGPGSEAMDAARMTTPAQASGPAQGAAAFDAQALPPLRKDLRLIDGGAAGRGRGAALQWKIHDPLAQRFFEVDRGVV